MQTALSLFEHKREVFARHLTELAASQLHLICPECLDLVHLVIRSNGSYFAHFPILPKSPPCSLRTESWGDIEDEYSDSRVRTIMQEELFRNAILVIYQIDNLEAVPKGLNIPIKLLIEKMQTFWLQNKQCFEVKDLPILGIDFTEKRSTTTEFIEDLSGRHIDKVGNQKGPENQYPSLGTKDHNEVVLLLWKHLHVVRAGDDLRFLVQTVCHLFGRHNTLEFLESLEGIPRPILHRFFLLSGLHILCRVPWLEIKTILPEENRQTCSKCNKVYYSNIKTDKPECEKCPEGYCYECRVNCDECSDTEEEQEVTEDEEWRCPDCGKSEVETISTGSPDYCIVCGELICSGCYTECESCHESVCDDCFHDAYVCEGCDETFCEDHPDQVKKVECPSCDDPYCENCAENDFQQCSICEKDVCEGCLDDCTDCGETICEACLENHVCADTTLET